MNNSSEEKIQFEESEPFLMVSMDKDEITTVYVNSMDDTPVTPIEIAVLNIEPQKNNTLDLPPHSFIFHKKYLQLLLVMSGVISGLLLAYDLKNQQAVEPRGVLAGFNVFASVLGLTYFTKNYPKKEKIDDEPALLKPN